VFQFRPSYAAAASYSNTAPVLDTGFNGTGVADESHMLLVKHPSSLLFSKVQKATQTYKPLC